MRMIEAKFTIDENADWDQVEYLIYCQLIDLGVPAEPLTHEIKYGNLYCVADALNPLKLNYFWIGPDRRT